MKMQVVHAKKRNMVLDPRTKILLTASVGLVIVLGGTSKVMESMKFALALAPALLYMLSGKVRSGIVCLAAYVAGSMVVRFVIPLTAGALNLMLSAICVIFVRFMPVVMMAGYMLATTTISEFTAAMERMHITQKLVIPLSVVFRFLPTVRQEYAAIADAMRMRGVRFGGGKASSMLEYRLVPMMICSVKIGEELSAAALTRGLGAPIRRTNICTIGFCAADFVWIAICCLAIMSLVLSGMGVL